MYVAICDDSEKDRSALRKLVMRFAAENNIEIDIQEYGSGQELLDAFRELKGNHIIIIDIYMKKENGMQTAKILREEGFAGEIIFSTISREYAIEGYQVKAAGYLVKPYGYREFVPYMKRAVDKAGENLRYLKIAYQRVERKVFYHEIMYVETEKRDSVIVTTRGKLRCRKTLSDLEQILCGEPNFLRCHRSAIINLNYVETANANYINMLDGGRLPINIKNGKKICQEIENYFSKQLNYNFFQGGGGQMILDAMLVFDIFGSFFPYGVMLVIFYWDLKALSAQRFVAVLMIFSIGATVICLVLTQVLHLTYERTNMVILILGILLCLIAKIFIDSCWPMYLFTTALILNIAAMVNGSVVLINCYLHINEHLDQLYVTAEIIIICLINIGAAVLMRKFITKRLMRFSQTKVWLFMTLPLAIVLASMVYGVNACMEIAVRTSGANLIKGIVMYQLLYMAVFVIQIGYTHLMIKTIKSESYKKEAETSKKLLYMQKQQYQILCEKDESARKLRHDLRHLKLSVAGLLQAGEQERVLSLFNKFVAEYENTDSGRWCRNLIINSLVSWYMTVARTRSIDFKTALNLGDMKDMDLDLAVLFGNALENAFESAAKAEKKEVRVSAGVRGQGIHIRFENTFDGVMKRSEGRYLSRKRGFKEKGIGIASIQTIAEKYGGMVHIRTEQYRFILLVVLKKNNAPSAEIEN
ncbi:GHKL domain-containing protein [Anaerovorax odorimutans]|uniref:Stage 0 sporulation protein A homolog n=1 Tax=Anaerovorax odorimutans TaxID=109327 RepID=A0ABT1RJ59_9FIRM|nr:GHKL domain-containing protein [Anaerovorax odorimutans]